MHIVISYDAVAIGQVIVLRPSYISRAQWLGVWEGFRQLAEDPDLIGKPRGGNFQSSGLSR
jgi:hypothetical protein